MRDRGAGALANDARSVARQPAGDVRLLAGPDHAQLARLDFDRALFAQHAMLAQQLPSLRCEYADVQIIPPSSEMAGFGFDSLRRPRPCTAIPAAFR